jgi:hypothetical protein
VRYIALFFLTIAAHLCAADTEPEAALAWFTDAAITNSVKTAPPQQLPPAAAGTVGKGVLLNKPVAIADPLLSRERGMISFWIRPNWDGGDGEAHRILRIGDPQRNGLLLEKSDKGMLRFVMASPEKITASRADISRWKAGEWHHVAIVWMDRDSKPLGLPLWIDKVAVDGPTAADNGFLDPEKMDDPRLWIGDETCQAAMDELIMRKELSTNLSPSQIAVVYRDYFATAPYTDIEINPDACFVPSDRRVVEGHEKQFGLKARCGGKMEPVTDYDVRYGQWSEFDAKPFIEWKTTDDRIAKVDQNGMVTGVACGKYKLEARFHGMSATYKLEVISPDQPDLDLLYVERLPRYRNDRSKDRPAPGDPVEYVAHVANYGYKEVPAGTVVRFELIPDSNGNFRIDPGERPTLSEDKVIEESIPPLGEETAEFPWRWTDDPIFLRTIVDPQNKVGEICEANNQSCDLNIARPLRFGYNPATLKSCYNDRKINHVGSFSYYDWITAQKLRLDKLVREAVWPTTTPDGIHDAFRLDKFYALKLDIPWEEEQYEKDGPYYDGGFPVNEPVNMMAVDSAIIHELGHTCLSLPDLYCYPVRASAVLLKDDNGDYYAGSDLLPKIDGDTLPYCSACNVPCGVGYDSLMNHCHQWLNPAQAGQVNYYRGYRGPRFWGTQGRNIPMREHYLALYDVNDDPLIGAAVYVYHCTQTGAMDSGTKFFADRPKFVGNTDPDGRFRFPDVTDCDWDDPDTDAVEGEWPVWNPFGRAKTTTGAPPDVAFTSNVWCTEGLLLLKVVSGDQTEFHWLPLTEMNDVFFSGERHVGVYPVRTSLHRSPGVTPIVRREIPEAIREKNLKPTAEVNVGEELTVHCGDEIVIDGSKSHDPEGQPLLYRWDVRGPGNPEPRTCQEAVYKGKAPTEPAELEIVFYVIDGLRVSDILFIKAHVVAPESK